MNTETEQSRIDFEAYVASVISKPVATISEQWTGERYSETSDLEPLWQCWTTAQKTIAQHSSKPAIRLELVRYLTDGLHIRKWENLDGINPGIHLLYREPVQLQREPVLQWSDDGACWMDGEPHEMASARAAGYATRALYTQPLPKPRLEPVAEDERKKAIDEISEAINRMPYTRKHLAECLYDAGYRKQVVR